jgi:hypothetical protein
VPGTLDATSASAEGLTATVDGGGGTATLWGGTAVAGGPTTTEHTLRHVSVNGHPVASRCRAVVFRTTAVDLSGCRLTFRLPPGRQVVDATP